MAEKDHRTHASHETETASPQVEAQTAAPEFANELAIEATLEPRARTLLSLQSTIGNQAMQRLIDQSRTTARPKDDLARRIQAASSDGNGLDAATRERLQASLGVDLTGVRVHLDDEADRLADSVEAIAFTTGHDVFFRKGMYQPETTTGLRLLAHEVTHTLQQSTGPVEGTLHAGGVSISDPSDQYEQAADRAAVAVTLGQSVAVSTAAAAPDRATSVQRQSEEEEILPNYLHADNLPQIDLGGLMDPLRDAGLGQPLALPEGSTGGLLGGLGGLMDPLRDAGIGQPFALPEESTGGLLGGLGGLLDPLRDAGIGQPFALPEESTGGGAGVADIGGEAGEGSTVQGGPTGVAGIGGEAGEGSTLVGGPIGAVGVGGAAGGFPATVGGALDAWRGGVRGAIGSGLDAAQGAGSALWSGATGAVNSALGGISGAGSAAWGGLEGAGGAISSGFDQAMSGDVLGGIASGVGGTAGSLWSGASGAVGSLASGAGGATDAWLGGVRGAVGSGVQGVQNAGSALWGGATGAAGALGGAASSLWDQASSILPAINPEDLWM